MDEFQSFSTVCPSCGEDGGLWVIEVRFVEFPEAEEIYMCSLLRKDGFEVSGDIPNYVPLGSDLSTEMEVVCCQYCDAKFDLADVTIG